MQNDVCSDEKQKCSLRSGVSLGYSPEDTLKTFIMEKYIRSGDTEQMDRNQQQINSNCDARHRNCPVIGTLKFNAPKRDESSPKKRTSRLSATQSSSSSDPPVKFPFLRKNHGNAAWCSRIRPSVIKAHTNVRIEPRESATSVDHTLLSESPPVAATPVSSLSSSTSLAENHRSYNNAIVIGSRSRGLNKLYTHNSPWCPLPKQNLFPTRLTSDEGLEEDSSSSKVEYSPPLPQPPRPHLLSLIEKPNGQVAEMIKIKKPLVTSVDVIEAGELEEFELLERITEEQNPQSSFDETFCNSAFVLTHKLGTQTNSFNQGNSSPKGLGSDTSPSASSPRKESSKDLPNGLPNVETWLEPCIKFDPDDSNSAEKGTAIEPTIPTKSTLLLSERPSIVSQKTKSADFDDTAPWHDVPDDVNTRKSSCREFVTPPASPASGYHSVRFNLPESHVNESAPRSNQAPYLGGDTATTCSLSEICVSPPTTSSLVKQWISQLEAEVKRFNTENAALAKLKEDRQQELAALERQRKQFEEQKLSQLKEFEKFRQDETDKLKRERQVLSDYQRALHSMPNKKDREIIEKLNQQISELQAEAAQKETRLQNQLTRQRIRIDELGAERTEMLERIKRLEQTRLTLQSNLTQEKAARLALAAMISPVPSAPSKSKSMDALTQSISFQTSKLVREPAKSLLNSMTPHLPFTNCIAPNASVALTDVGELADAQRSTPVAIPKTIPSVDSREPDAEKSFRRSRCPSGQSDYYTGEEDLSSSTTGSIIRVPELGTSNQIPFSQLPIISHLSPNTEFPRGPIVREVCHPDGSIEKMFTDGSKILKYANGSVKEIFPDGKTSLVRLYNGDAKRTLADNTVIYTYASEGTVQTTYPDGTEEIVYKNGRKEVNYPHKTNTACAQLQRSASQLTASSISQEPVVVEEVILPDGGTLRRYSNGNRILNLANGQREVHCAEYKQRIYPDGTTKTVYKNGKQETRYASGRIRTKDSEGRLLVDTKMPPPDSSLSLETLRTAPLRN